MNKKLYVKPSMRVKPIRISNLICASGPFTSFKFTNSSDNDDPDYDDTSSGDIWYAN